MSDGFNALHREIGHLNLNTLRYLTPGEVWGVEGGKEGAHQDRRKYAAENVEVGIKEDTEARKIARLLKK